MIYLASAYSHPDAVTRLRRFEQALAATVLLAKQGHLVFSPIVHSHWLHVEGLPGDWTFWEKFDRWFIERCDQLVVLQNDGWNDSKGIAAEVSIATEILKPVYFWDGKSELQFQGDK